jgi:glutamyl/glutaminyl-tRNA synthetase
MFLDPDSYDPEGVFKHWKLPQTAARLSQLMEILASIDPFEENNIENQIRALADQLGISAAKLIHPTRLALTGTTYSPGLFELIACLGRDTVLRRLKNAVNFLENQQQSESNS